MTALLDPAQIEEREHRRLKQFEHQVRFKLQGKVTALDTYLHTADI